MAKKTKSKSKTKNTNNKKTKKNKGGKKLLSSGEECKSISVKTKTCGEHVFKHSDGKQYTCRNPSSFPGNCSSTSGTWGSMKAYAGPPIVEENPEAAPPAEPAPAEPAPAPEAPAKTDDIVIEKKKMRLGDAIYYSATTLPLVITQSFAKKYINIVNGVAERYLAMANISPNAEGEALNKAVKKSMSLFTNYIKIVATTTTTVIKEGLKEGVNILQDPEIKRRLNKFFAAAGGVTKIFTQQLIQLSEDGLPLIKKQRDKYLTVFKNTATSASKAGINAGLNAMQAVPGLGQALSVIRMIHSITMPAFIFQRKMSNLALKTADDVIKIAEKNQPMGMKGLDKTLKLLKEGVETQEAAAKKVVDFTDNMKANIETSQKDMNKALEKAKAKKGGYRSKRRRRRTRKKSLKKRHRRKSRRRMRRKSRRYRR